MITTVIPTYCRPRLLARAIRSVLRQTYTDFQVIVYDNASGDETAAVVAEVAAADHRVKYRVHPQNIGALANFNFALGRIDTEYFSLLSDDDVLLPYFYEQAMATFAAHPSAMFVASPVMVANERGRVLMVNNPDWPAGLHPAPKAMLRMAEREHFIWTGTVFRRRAIERGTMDLEAGMCSDLDLLLRIAGRHAIAVAERPGAVFLVHSGSTSSFPRLSMYWPSWTRIIANAGRDDLVPLDVRAAVQRSLERRLAGLLFRVGIFSSSRGYFQEAKEAASALRSRYRSPARVVLMRAVTLAAEHLPLVRRLLAGAISWMRWRRGPVTLEQRILDGYPGLLVIGGGPNRQDAAA